MVTYSNLAHPSSQIWASLLSVFTSPSARPSQGDWIRVSHSEKCPGSTQWPWAAYPLAQKACSRLWSNLLLDSSFFWQLPTGTVHRHPSTSSTLLCPAPFRELTWGGPSPVLCFQFVQLPWCRNILLCEDQHSRGPVCWDRESTRKRSERFFVTRMPGYLSQHRVW